MNYLHLEKSLRKYAPANALDRLIPLNWREKMKDFLIDLTIIIFILSFAFPLYSGTVAYTSLAQGLALFFLGLTFLVVCIESFYEDLYFDDLPTIYSEPHFKIPDMSGTYIVSEIMKKVGRGDIVTGLFRSRPGNFLAIRLDIPLSEINLFLKNKKEKITPELLDVQIEDKSDLFDCFVTSLYKLDREFKEFVFKYSVKEKELSGTAKWITKQFERDKREKRWWGRDYLSRMEGIGKDWSYGKAFLLEKYATKIEDSYNFSGSGLGHHKKEVGEMESILTRRNEANVLLVSDDDLQKMGILIELSKKIIGDKILALQNKNVLILDINQVITGKRTKAEFEEELVNMLSGAERAGNIILVLKNLPGSMINSKALESDLLGLMGPYLNSPSLQFIALSDIKSFHEHIENNLSAMEKFETMLLKEDTEDNLVYNLQKETAELEQRFGVLFTYSSLVSIAENASRYFMGQIISDKALNMLLELPQLVRKQGRKIITKKDVLDMLQEKTGIPMGEISKEEKDKLLNLEEILHKHVISQDEAISAISSTLRRSRSGIESENKPMGSFLFLGPTGVGKTETAKALSEVFFGSEKKMTRLDMSEYSGPDSISKLIGSFETGKQGVLTSLLRESQYGVLLLDEFEKASREVHNLFLQILDEGVFSDMVGKKVNARNLIIIATSNAGSSTIWNFVKEGKSLADNKQIIVDEIIQQGLFRPELLNRFDGVILFHPLDNSDLKQIATLMLKKLAKRLEDKSLELVITDELIDYLVEKGSDPTFGARPINRAIQDNVEEIVARKLIGGEVKPGSKLTISKEDLEAVERK